MSYILDIKLQGLISTIKLAVDIDLENVYIFDIFYTNRLFHSVLNHTSRVQELIKRKIHSLLNSPTGNEGEGGAKSHRGKYNPVYSILIFSGDTWLKQ